MRAIQTRPRDQHHQPRPGFKDVCQVRRAPRQGISHLVVLRHGAPCGFKCRWTQTSYLALVLQQACSQPFRSPVHPRPTRSAHRRCAPPLPSHTSSAASPSRYAACLIIIFVCARLCRPQSGTTQVANLEAAVDRYRLQEEEWQTKLNQSDGQARVILVMSEQVSSPHSTVPSKPCSSCSARAGLIATSRRPSPMGGGRGRQTSISAVS